MRQSRTFFPEDNIPRRNFAISQSKEFFSNFFTASGIEKSAVIAISNSKDVSVKYFDLATSSAFNTASRKESDFITARDFSSNAKLFKAEKNNTEDLLELMLFYFDQIVYLNEISEKLRKLEIAVREENIAQVNAIARECIEISNNCEIATAIAPLQHLTQLKTRLQMTDAAFLINQVRKEFRSFRLALKENLGQLTKQVRLDNPASRS